MDENKHFSFGRLTSALKYILPFTIFITSHVLRLIVVVIHPTGKRMHCMKRSGSQHVCSLIVFERRVSTRNSAAQL